MKKKRKIKWKNVFLFAFIIILFTVFIISIIKIIFWIKDSNSSNDKIKDLQNNTVITEVSDSQNTEIIGDDIDKFDPYWDYIKIKLIDVNFDELKNINNDTIGWIQVNGTNINYPFVQTKDNDFYLTHTFDKSYNNAGWVFMDYRNDSVNFDKNTIIYAHGRLDKTMFGSLRKIITSGWLNDKDNYIIKLSTETENTLWQVFSVYRIPTTNDYLKTSFSSDQEFLDFTNMLIDRSYHNFSTKVSSDSKILTLSTCYNDFDKIVLHAKLIKREKK